MLIVVNVTKLENNLQKANCTKVRSLPMWFTKVNRDTLLNYFAALQMSQGASLVNRLIGVDYNIFKPIWAIRSNIYLWREEFDQITLSKLIKPDSKEVMSKTRLLTLRNIYKFHIYA